MTVGRHMCHAMLWATCWATWSTPWTAVDARFPVCTLKLSPTSGDEIARIDIIVISPSSLMTLFCRTLFFIFFALHNRHHDGLTMTHQTQTHLTVLSVGPMSRYSDQELGGVTLLSAPRSHSSATRVKSDSPADQSSARQHTRCTQNEAHPCENQQTQQQYASRKA